MEASLRDALARIGAETGVEVAISDVSRFAPTAFDAGMVGRVREAVIGLGLSHMDIVSGAGHDAVYLAKIAPTAMIFVPCEGGISHNEVENAQPADLEAGCNVLLHAVLAAAG